MILKVTSTACFSFIERNILLVKLIDYSEIEVKDVHENFEATMQIIKGKKYAVLVDGRVNVTITAEARALAAKREFQENLIAQAILVTSLANRLIGNFIIKFNKPYAPTQLFSQEELALQWLREEIRKDNDRNKKNNFNFSLV